MIPELEGIHVWDGGVITLNDLSAWPRYRVRELDGFGSTPDFAPEADDAIGRLGEVPRRGDRAGKTVTYLGEVEALTLLSLAEARAALIAAFATTDEKRMDVELPSGWAGAAIEERYFFARPLDCTVEGIQGSPRNASRGRNRVFSLALRMSDPRFYHPTEIDVNDDVASAMGGVGVPFTPGGSGGGPDAEGFEIITDNPGNAPDTPGIVRMRGPLVNPVISNETQGVFLRFKGLEIDADNSVSVDFRRRRAYRTESGNNVRHTLDPASTWWDRDTPCFVPGNNTIRLRAYDVGAGAQLRLIYNPADIA